MKKRLLELYQSIDQWYSRCQRQKRNILLLTAIIRSRTDMTEQELRELIEAYDGYVEEIAC